MQPQPPHQQPLPQQTAPQKSEMFPAIPIPTAHTQTTPPHTQATLTLSPTALYGSTQKLWTTEMLSNDFNSLLPSIKPKVPPKLGTFS
jgi:hypothetical protein